MRHLPQTAHWSTRSQPVSHTQLPGLLPSREGIPLGSSHPGCAKYPLIPGSTHHAPYRANLVGDGMGGRHALEAGAQQGVETASGTCSLCNAHTFPKSEHHKPGYLGDSVPLLLSIYISFAHVNYSAGFNSSLLSS